MGADGGGGVRGVLYICMRERNRAGGGVGVSKYDEGSENDMSMKERYSDPSIP
jgi:hypothetical protein